MRLRSQISSTLLSTGPSVHYLYVERRGLDIDDETAASGMYPGGGALVGRIYNMSYTKAMLQAVLSS